MVDTPTAAGRVVEVYLAAGSNVEPALHLGQALAELEAAFGPLRVSPAYRNKAVGFEGADFINLVVGFGTQQALPALRQRLQQIEALCGRPPQAPQWAPRTMDLDILLYGTHVSDEPGLLLPRPDLVRRPYMLKPLVDLAPDLEHPTLHRTMRELWCELAAADHAMVAVTIPHYARRRPPGSGQ